MKGYVQANGGWGKRPPSTNPTELTVPCSMCVGCRIDKSREWAVRCVHEAQLYGTKNAFITLTYAPEHLPQNGSLNKKHFQDFMKRLRKKFVPLNPYNKNTQENEYNEYQLKHQIRFYHCGEYGEKLQRPHYHAIIFNIEFPDKTFLKKINGMPLYWSPILTKIWGKGHASFGDVTFESAAYVSRYIMKKINGAQQAEHYEKLDIDTGEIIHLQPEYTTMSRKPGIASRWYDKYSTDVFPHDEVVLLKKTGAQIYKTPKYYTDKYQHTNPEQHAELKIKRLSNLEKYKEDSTKERLAQREYIQNNKLKRLIRHKEPAS